MRNKMRFSAAVMLICLSWSFTVYGDDLIIDQEATGTISNQRDLAAPDKVDNAGTLKITDSGILNIADGVVNVTEPAEGTSGLNLGVVNSTGRIDAETFLRFAEGSLLGGTLISTGNIAFDGVSKITGSVQADKLIVNAAGSKDDKKDDAVFHIDLTGSGASLDVNELIVNASTKIDVKNGKTLQLDSLYIGEKGTSLVISGDLVVQGSYTGMANTTIGSDPDVEGKFHGTITLLGEGAKEDGENNVIAQSSIYAKQLKVKNYTRIDSALTLYGDMTVLEGGTDEGTESRLMINTGLMTQGKMTVEKNAILRFNSEDEKKMFYHGYYYYSGVFLGGFELQDGVVMDVQKSDQAIQVAVGGKSSIAATAEVHGGSVHFSGVDPSGSGNSKAQAIENRGTITADKELSLRNITLSSIDTGIIEANSIKLLGTSVLELAGSSELKFTGKDRLLDIGASSSVLATEMTIDLTGVEVVNKNTSNGGAITAGTLIFGKDSSLSGPGLYKTDAKFMAGSTLKIDNTGLIDFGEGDIFFEKGSTIELTIGTNGLGAALTDGTISMEEGVVLEITDGSNYTGRTRQFQILQGAEDSTFNDLTLAESLFFELNGTLYDEKGGLWVEIVKVNELVDYAKSSNQKGLSTMIDKLLNEGRVSDNQKSVFNALMRIANDNQYRQALNELSGSSRENAVLFALASPWQRPFNSVGFNRLSLALPTPSRATDSDDPMMRGQQKSWMPRFSTPKWNRPQWSFSHDLWAETYYSYTTLNDDGNSQGGYGNRGGFHAGTALPSPSKESLLGIALGYSAGEYKQANDKADLGDFRIGLYGGVNLFRRNLQLRGYVGYGMQDYKYKRNVQVGNNKPLATSGDTDGDSVAAAIYLVRPMDISYRYLFKPMIGFDMERVTQDGFQENGVAAVALRFGDVTLNRVMFRLGATADYEFDRFELTGRFLYGLKVSGDNAASSTHRFRSPGNDPFEIRSINIGDYTFDLGVGGNWSLNRRRNVVLFLDYNANFTKNSSIHATSLGLLWKR